MSRSGSRDAVATKLTRLAAPSLNCRAEWDFGIRAVLGLGIRCGVWGFRLRVQGLGCRVSCKTHARIDANTTLRAPT